LTIRQITLCFLSEDNLVAEHIYSNRQWTIGDLGVTVKYEALPGSQLSGTLLRQEQPSNGPHVWEPYVLYYQQKDFTFQELVYVNTGGKASWIDSTIFGVTAFAGSPVTVCASQGGYTLDLFFLRDNDTQLLHFFATASTANSSSYDNGLLSLCTNLGLAMTANLDEQTFSLQTKKFSVPGPPLVIVSR
jgi:hypothetical protein